MRTIEQGDSFSNRSSTALQNLVERLIKTQSAIAERNKSSIVNNVSPYLSISGDRDVALVLHGLLHSVIVNARESCISVSAKELYGKTVVVSVKDNNSFNTYAVACGLQDVVQLAERIGGDLDITNQGQNITTVTFSFPIVEKEQEHFQSFEYLGRR